MQLLHFVADPCHHYKNLSEASRKVSYSTPVGLGLCDNQLPNIRNGIVLWELQEQKCQQHVCQHTNVVQTGQAGWWLLILKWKMVRFKGRSALVIALLVANTQQKFMSKTVDPTSSTNLKSHVFVTYATVVQTECKANVLRVVRGLINRSVGTCVQGFDMRRIQLFFSIVNIISRF